MVLGLALFSWDIKAGAILEVKFPENLELSLNLINKVYMSHAIKEEFIFK